MDNQFFIKQTEEVINEYNALKKQAQYEDLSDLEANSLTKLMTKSRSLVVRIAGENSEYFKSMEVLFPANHMGYGDKLNGMIGSVIALKEDLEDNYMKSYSEILHSEIFSNYIDIANHLIEKGYKDSSAVIIGSILESHLRNLCGKNNIESESENSQGKLKPKKADSMNSELYKTNSYTLAYSKQITAWLDIRNNAAHGKYEEFTEPEVKLMIQGVQTFIINYPA